MSNYKTTLVLEEVRRERERQESLLAAGRFPFTAADPTRLNAEKLPILGEEFGEVSKEVYEDGLGARGAAAKLRTELIQLAAVATAWVEALTPE